MASNTAPQLIDDMVAFFHEQVPRLPATYKWKIPASAANLGFRALGQTQFHQTGELRKFLSEKWKFATQSERRDLARWFVADWGGIKRNSNVTLDSYATDLEAKIFDRGIGGIASWSKVFVLRDPNRFAIFDARVAAALNALQVDCSGSIHCLFPRLPGRNSVIRTFAGERFTNSSTVRINRRDVYQVYLNLLQRGRERTGYDLHSMEMALFAEAEVLVSKVLRSQGYLTRVEPA